MRALVSTDLHSSPRAASAIAATLREGVHDVHLCLGDIITFRPLEYLVDLLGSTPVRTHTLPGNTDSDEARTWLEDRGHDLHFRRVEVAGVTIAGAGGCPPPPFRTAFKVEEGEYARRLPGLLPGTDVLALHAPPKGILDRTMFGMRVGSTAVREALEGTHPRVAVSGHIHEAQGILLWDWPSGREVAREATSMEAEVGPDQTLFMNPGPAKDGLLGELRLEGEGVSARIVRA